jgi:hypothetical protein
MGCPVMSSLALLAAAALQIRMVGNGLGSARSYAAPWEMRRRVVDP